MWNFLKNFACLSLPAASMIAMMAVMPASSADDVIQVTLITKDPDNHFWTSMVEGAQKAAKDKNVQITIEAGRDQSDADGQIQAIENAISRGDKAIKKARGAGLYVLALDTPTTPLDLVDATLASDNFEAGTLIGKWVAGSLGGKKATVALLDLFSDKIVSVDVQRDQGFITGMGIDAKDSNTNGDEAKTGKYSGGDYEIICNEATNGSEDGGRKAMENCLSLNPDVNVVFTANETSGVGGDQCRARRYDVLGFSRSLSKASSCISRNT